MRAGCTSLCHTLCTFCVSSWGLYYTIIQVRFVNMDDIWLSGEYQSSSCHITLLIYNPSNKVKQDFFNSLHQLVRREGHNPRLHLGKYVNLSKEEAHEVYPKFPDFMRVRSLMDPKGIFLNDMLNKIFVWSKIQFCHNDVIMMATKKENIVVGKSYRLALEVRIIKHVIRYLVKKAVLFWLWTWNQCPGTWLLPWWRLQIAKGSADRIVWSTSGSMYQICLMCHLYIACIAPSKTEISVCNAALFYISAIDIITI